MVCPQAYRVATMTLPTIRLFVSPCRSGSTAFMQSLNQSDDIHCFYQPMKEGIREGTQPDYSFFDGSHPAFTKYAGKIFFAKEVLGHTRPEECNFELFPDDEAIARSRPLFLLRDPVGTWSSWKKCKAAGKEGWEGVCDLEMFKLAYAHTYNTFVSVRSVSEGATCLTREHLLKDPRRIFQLICEHWGIPFTDEMIQWKKSFDVNSFTVGEKSHRSDSKVSYDHAATFNRVQHKDVREASGFYRVEDNEGRTQEALVTESERQEIEASLRGFHNDFSEWCQEYYPLVPVPA